MAPISRKRIIYIAISLVAVGLVFAWSLPFMTTPKKMAKYCQQLVSGTPYDSVKVSAAELDFKTTELRNGRAVVHEPRTMGRYTCLLEFDGVLLKKSESFHD